MDFSEGEIGGRISLDERWYNITRSIIEQGAEDADNGNYTCRVCTDADTPDEKCNDAVLELFLAGEAPMLEIAPDDGEDCSLSYVSRGSSLYYIWVVLLWVWLPHPKAPPIVCG